MQRCGATRLFLCWVFPPRFQWLFRQRSHGPSLHPPISALRNARPKSWLRLMWQHLQSSHFIMTVLKFAHKQERPTPRYCLVASLHSCRPMASPGCSLSCHQLDPATISLQGAAFHKQRNIDGLIDLFSRSPSRTNSKAGQQENLSLKKNKNDAGLTSTTI